MTADEFTAAMVGSDFAAISAALADDVVLRSPITDRFRFEGREEVLEILTLVREALSDLSYGPAYGGGSEAGVLFSARLGRQQLEGHDYLRFDERGRIREFRIFVRPLPGLAKLAAELAPLLGRRRSRWRALLLRVLTPPLAAFNRIGDAIGTRLAR